ncbi:hypothetical protein E2C01_053042 [Portunus trituberculatus]|uniref:Uncharacterized protein n=1 Tax=Portunus trituberculatus TaxID=210409 RepID=A0A5B7GND9_PORTR|nr:hypothetical protein [Portunus trituberculatus]
MYEDRYVWPLRVSPLAMNWLGMPIPWVGGTRPRCTAGKKKDTKSKNFITQQHSRHNVERKVCGVRAAVSTLSHAGLSPRWTVTHSQSPKRPFLQTLGLTLPSHSSDQRLANYRLEFLKLCPFRRRGAPVLVIRCTCQTTPPSPRHTRCAPLCTRLARITIVRVSGDGRADSGAEWRSVEVERNMPARAPRLPATMMNGRPDALNKRRPLVQVAGEGRRVLLNTSPPSDLKVQLINVGLEHVSIFALAEPPPLPAWPRATPPQTARRCRRPCLCRGHFYPICWM